MKHLIHSILILIPFFPVAPVLIRYLPSLLRGVLPVLKTRKLRILVYLDPELYYYRAPVLKLPLELIYLIVGSLPVILAAEALKPLDHNPSVPCSVKNSDMACLRKSCPETPQIVSRFLMRFRTGNRVHIIPARVKRTCDSLYITALACRIPAFIGDDNRHLLPVQLIMELGKLLLALCKLLSILHDIHILIKLNLRQHRHAP